MVQPKPTPAKDTRTRILLVDDHAVVRYGIAQLINREADLVVCGEEENASNALSAIERLRPGLVIADISLKDSSGLELMRALRARGIWLPAVALTGYGRERDVQESHEAGFIAHITKPVDVARLDQAIAKAWSAASRGAPQA